MVYGIYTNVLNQNIKDLENFPKIYKSLELKLKETVEQLKGNDTEIVETEKNFKKGNFSKKTFRFRSF